MSYLNKITKEDLQDLFSLIPELQKHSKELMEKTIQTKKYYNSCNDKDKLRDLQELENKWYLSLKNNQPDYSVYSSKYFICDAWCCWLICSRKYIKAIIKNNIIPENTKTILDIGNGIGYSTKAIEEAYPNAEVLGYNLKDTLQWTICKKINCKMTDELIKADVVFCSEYFEHIEEPIKHLLEIINKCNPQMLIIANSFNSTSVGHFLHFKYNNELIPRNKIGKIFNNTLRANNYTMEKYGLWNNRPNIWVKN